MFVHVLVFTHEFAEVTIQEHRLGLESLDILVVLPVIILATILVVLLENTLVPIIETLLVTIQAISLEPLLVITQAISPEYLVVTIQVISLEHLPVITQVITHLITQQTSSSQEYLHIVEQDLLHILELVPMQTS